MVIGRRTLVVIYLRGPTDHVGEQLDLLARDELTHGHAGDGRTDVAQQLRACLAHCEARGYVPVAVCHDDGDLTGWEDAMRLRRLGRVATVVVASVSFVPEDVLESVTGSLPGPHRKPPRRRSRHRRTRPVRGDGPPDR
jgi:hypothetical protein